MVMPPTLVEASKQFSPQACSVHFRCSGFYVFVQEQQIILQAFAFPGLANKLETMKFDLGYDIDAMKTATL
jgi:hypothetical protein